MDFGRVLCTHVVVVFIFRLLSGILRGQTAFHTLNGLRFYFIIYYRELEILYNVIIGPFVPFGSKKNQQIKYSMYILLVYLNYLFFLFFFHLLHRWRRHKFFGNGFPSSVSPFCLGFVNLFGHALLTFQFIMLALFWS